MSDLIEQWKRYKKEGIVEDNYHGFDNLIEATIEALSPTMPDDVADEINKLRAMGYMYRQTDRVRSAAMLERQARENAHWHTCWLGACEVEDELKQRIEELEAEKEQDKENRRLVSMVVENFTDEDKARIRAALAERNE